MARIIPGIATPLQAGTWQFNAVLTTGTILMQMSSDDGATFRTMTDGTIAATEDGIMMWGQNNLFKAVISGDGVIDIDPIELL